MAKPSKNRSAKAKCKARGKKWVPGKKKKGNKRRSPGHCAKK
jgi:hypothetical protein